ncbi:tail protein from Bacteriophage (fragment) [Escherichia coli]
MLPSETMIWQPEFTDKILSRKPGAVHTGVITFCAVISTRHRRLLVIFVEIWTGIAAFWPSVFPRAGVFNDLTIRQLHPHQIEHTGQFKLDNLMSFESFLFDKPHFIREMLVWICCWVAVFKINGIEEASQRHLANNAAANKIVVRLNFRRDGSGKVRYLNFWTWQRSLASFVKA